MLRLPPGRDAVSLPADVRSRPTLRRAAAGSAALVFAAACGGAPPQLPAGFDPSKSDARAIEVALRAGEALGGPRGWAATRYLTFDFVVEAGGAPPVAYRHYWDVAGGRYRVEGMDEEQRPYLVLFNLQTRRGMTWLEGRPARGEERERLLKEAYERHINDVYWLLMPLKMLDPGARVHYEGELGQGRDIRDRIRLSFDPGIGLTPGDTYWAEVSRASGRMERWEFVLEGETERYGYRWEDWRRFGPLTLSTRKESEDGSERILFLNVVASEELDDKPFELPAASEEAGPV
jgi:hypothetical protein